MADITISCPHCDQQIECDEQWVGHDLQCPTCQKHLTVPPSTPAAAPTPPAPAAQVRLRVSAAHADDKPVVQATPPPSPLLSPVTKKKNPVVQWIINIVTIAALGVGGYYGYNYYIASKKQKEQEASPAPAAQNNLATPADASAAPVAEQAPGATSASAPKKELEALTAVWTLDMESATITEGKANGTVGGVNVVVDSARIDKVGAMQALTLRQGAAGANPEVVVYLPLGTGEKLAGHAWAISKEMKGKGVPQVLKTWRPNPKFAPVKKNFMSGYVMKLELGEPNENIIPGKIYLSLPDTEQSVIAGIFEANIGAPALTPGAPAAATGPAAEPALKALPADAKFKDRYGL